MTTYYGDEIAYSSTGRWRVLMDVWWEGDDSSSAVTIKYQYKVNFNYSINDTSNTRAWTDPWSGGAQTAGKFDYVSGVGKMFTGVIGVETNEHAVGIVYGAETPLYFKFSVNSIGLGATGPSTVEFTFNAPGRRGKAPDQPAAPTISAGVTYNSATVNMVMPFTNGYGITDTAIQLFNLPSGGTRVAYDTSGSPLTSWTFTGLTPSTTYYAEAAALNAGGWSTPSVRTPFTTAAAGVPGQTPKPTVSAITATTATITWGASAPNGSTVSEYLLQVSTSPSFATILASISSTADLVEYLAGLTRYTTYYLRMNSRNATGWGGTWSPTATFYTLPTAPAQIGLPGVSGQTSESIVLSWLAPDSGGPPITSYQVQASRSLAFTTVIDVPLIGGTTSTTIAGLESDALYYFRVRAGNTVGLGAWSLARTGTTEPGLRLSTETEYLPVRAHLSSSGGYPPVSLHAPAAGGWS